MLRGWVWIGGQGTATYLHLYEGRPAGRHTGWYRHPPSALIQRQTLLQRESTTDKKTSSHGWVSYFFTPSGVIPSWWSCGFTMTVMLVMKVVMVTIVIIHDNDDDDVDDGDDDGNDKKVWWMRSSLGPDGKRGGWAMGTACITWHLRRSSSSSSWSSSSSFSLGSISW